MHVLLDVEIGVSTFFHTRAPLSIFQRRKEDEETDRMNEIERRVLAGQLSHEDAILARQRLVEENTVQAAAVKAERVKLEAMCVRVRVTYMSTKGRKPAKSPTSASSTLNPPTHQDGTAAAAGR